MTGCDDKTEWGRRGRKKMVTDRRRQSQEARLTSSLVLCRDIQDAIGVNVKDNIDLRHASRSGRDATELKLAQQVVVLSAGALSLEYLDKHARLVVGVGGEDLLLLGGDGGVPCDQGGLQSS